jgi:hypothetical protein
VFVNCNLVIFAVMIDSISEYEIFFFGVCVSALLTQFEVRSVLIRVLNYFMCKFSDSFCKLYRL